MTKFNPNQLPTVGYLCNGRLTLETGVPISTSDQADKVTLYFTPYMGDLIYIYDGTSWVLHSFTELSLDISGFTASKPYDIFIYDNAGTLTLEGLVWTNATTRATALTTQNGVYVLTDATNKRYLGTIYMDAASKCQDTENKRYLWNYYNRKDRKAKKTCGGSGHTYNTASWRYFNNDAANSLSFICGLKEDMLSFQVGGRINPSGGTYGYAGIGIDGTNQNHDIYGWGYNAGDYGAHAFLNTTFIGFHTIYNIEYASGATIYWYTYILLGTFIG